MKRVGLVIALAMVLLPVFAQAQSTVKLSCSLEGEFIIVNVDETNSTVNGHTANITADMIVWGEVIGRDSTSYHINRYTGDIKMDRIDDNHPWPGLFVYGKCEKATEKRF
jgi:hypothetical protein